MSVIVGPLEGAFPVNPRIQERREAVADELRTRRVGRMIFALAIAVLFLFAFVLTRSALLDVDSIVVNGTRHVALESVEAASGIQLGDPLVDLDLAAAREAIAALPWVATVEIDQTMRGTVEITIQERVAAAVLLTPERAITVDGDGRILEVIEGSPRTAVGDLIPILGLDLDATGGHWIDESALRLVAVAQALPTEIAAATYGLEMTADGLELYLGSKVGRVLLGDGREMEAKVWAIRAAAANVDLHCLDALDIRAPSVPVLTFREDCP